MKVDCRVDTVDPRIVVASVAGNLNQDGTDQLWRATSSRLDEQHPLLVVDLGGVELMTSAGLGTIVRLHHRVHKLGGRIAIFGANSRVSSVIEVVMLTDILNLCETIEDARSRVGGRSPVA